MSLAEKLKDSVSQCFIQRTDAMLAELAPPDAVRDHIQAYAVRRSAEITELADALGDPEDETELYRSAGFLWLELKTEWVRYNQTMQYQVARRGEAETTVFAKGAVCADLIGAIEPLLLPSDLEMLTTLSAEPLDFGKADVTQIRRLLAHQDRVMSQIGRIFASASSARNSTIPQETLEARSSFAAELRPGSLTRVAARYERLLGDLLKETEDALVLPHELLLPAYKGAVEQQSADLGRRVQLVTDAPDNVPIDMRIARALEDCVARAARALITQTAAAIDAVPTLLLRLSASSDETRITLECDRQTAPLAGAAVAELEEVAKRIDARVAATSGEADGRSSIVISLARLSGGNPFVAIPGARWPLCVRSSSVAVVSGAVAAFVDVRAEQAGSPACFVRVELSPGHTVVLGCDGAPEEVCGLVLPSSAAPVTEAAKFDFCVLTSSTTFGVLTERAIDALRPAPVLVAAA
jgi:hypothetical protein